MGSVRRRRARPGVRTLVGAIVVISSCGSAALAPSVATAASYPSADVTLVGHGYGGGEGMGQWGAFGYALDGSSWQDIVDHYYSGSSPAELTAPQESTSVRVVLTENNGNDVIVTSGNGFNVNGTPIAAGHAVLMHSIGGGAWDLYSGSGCAGPTWTSFATGVDNPQASPDTDPALGAANASTLALQLCHVPANIVVRGAVEATYNTGSPASPRTVNVVPLEDYVAGVVPNESPAYWGQIGSIGAQGQPQGFQELEAQAVAARSYVMAGLGSYGDYADTCDLTCQTYHGLENENPLTDAATLDTSGYVMEFGDNGVPLTTQYSASTGGYTAPGVFPAVPDAGDSVCPPGIAGACNPDHTWNVSIPVATVESAWPQLGTLQSIVITSRNGFGDWGGRVLSMTLAGSAQDVVLTGDQFAAALGLMSDWFTLTDALPAPAVSVASTPDGKGYWINGSDGSVVAFGDASYVGSMSGDTLVAPVVSMARTPDGKGYWEVASDGGIFSFGDAHFYGSMGG
ncbi:MAG: SpoIID/LytB domain-containing protein, partial [Acidimicrobiales bacterium]